MLPALRFGIGVLLAIGACGDAASDYTRAVAVRDALHQRACACTTAACAEAVRAEHAALLAGPGGRPDGLSQGQLGNLARIDESIVGCLTRATGAAAPLGSGAAPP